MTKFQWKKEDVEMKIVGEFSTYREEGDSVFCYEKEQKAYVFVAKKNGRSFKKTVEEIEEQELFFIAKDVMRD